MLEDDENDTDRTVRGHNWWNASSEIVIDHRENRNLKGELKNLNGAIFRRDGILDILDRLQKTDKTETTTRE